MDQPRRDELDDLEALMKDFLDRVRAEPVPDKLRELAGTLEKKLEIRDAPIRSKPPALP